MKQKINGPIGTIILILSVIAILVFGFSMVKDPPGVSPEETQRMMGNAMKQQAEQASQKQKR